MRWRDWGSITPLCCFLPAMASSVYAVNAVFDEIAGQADDTLASSHTIPVACPPASARVRVNYRPWHSATWWLAKEIFDAVMKADTGRVDY